MKARIIAITCALSVVISAVFVADVFKHDTIAQTKSARSGDELTAEEVKNATLPREDVPVGMSYDEAVAEGHRVRLYDQEPNDYTVIFQNADDTRTMYYYNVPVKHTAGGNTFDIDLTVEKSNNKKYQYQNTKNSVQLGFPKNIQNGVDIVGDRAVSVKPVFEGIENTTVSTPTPVSAPNGALMVTVGGTAMRYMSASVNEEPEVITATDEYVEYPNAFGPDTTLRYTPVVNGVKQDVILDKNIGENTFSFDFDFGNQEILEEVDGTLSVVDTETEEITGFITPIKVYDANGTEADGCYYTYEKIESGEWRITANVNEEFLNSEDTVYPVTVDPDYIDTPDYGVKDAILSNGEPNTNYGSAASLYVGNNSNVRVMRVLIGFSKLDLSNIDPSQMYYAAFSLKDTVQSTSSLTVQAYEYLNSWTESEVTWNSAGMNNASNYSASPVSTMTISQSEGADNTYPHRYYFKFKETAQKWCQYKHYQSYGFMLKSSNEATTRYCTFGSYNGTSNKPTLVFRYYPPQQTLANGTYYLKNGYSGGFLTRVNDSTHAHNVRQELLAGTSAQRWTIEYYADGYYYIHEEDNPNRNLKVEHDDNGNNVRTAVTTEGSDYQLYRIIESKYGYRIMSKKYPLQSVQLATKVTTPGENVIRADYGKSTHQEWFIWDEGTVPEYATVTPETAKIKVGETLQLSCAITPSTASQVVTWTSSNTAVASVNANGLVTAIAPGTVTITGASKNCPYASDTCTITVQLGDNLDLEDSTSDGATPIRFSVIETDNTYGTTYSTQITGHEIYDSSDVDYYKLELDNLIMVEIQIPQNITVTVEDSENNSLGDSSNADSHLKVKTTLNPCYIKVTSNTAGEYALTVKAYCEK